MGTCLCILSTLQNHLEGLSTQRVGPTLDVSRPAFAFQISTQVTVLLLVQAPTLRATVLEESGGKFIRGESIAQVCGLNVHWFPPTLSPF